MRYLAYQLHISSAITLPELDRAQDQDTIDVSITLGAVPSDGLQGGTQIGPFLWATDRTLWLDVPDIARFLIANGATITVDPYPGVDEASIRVFLLGSAFGALLFQRGLLVLHGNAIRVGDACMICVGASGAGKSTTAAGFHQRGFAVLADDVVPIDAQCHALPGVPRIKLWQEAAEHLKIDTTGLPHVRPTISKFSYALDAQFGNERLPVRWIYLLHQHNRDEIVFEPVTGMQRFAPLHENTYRRRFLTGMSLNGSHLALSGQLAGKLRRMVKVTRPRDRFCLDELIDKMVADMAAHP